MNIPTILIVDDDVVLLARLATQLKEAGYETVQATSVRQAEQALGNAPVDLALIEPAVDRRAGWEFLPRLAQRVPTIVISGDGLEEDVVRGFDAGAVDYLTKPFRTGELLARLRTHLRLRSGSDAAVPPIPPATTEQSASESPPDQAPVAARVIDLGDDDEILDRSSHNVAGTPESPARSPAQASSAKRLRRERSAEEEEESVFIPHAEERGLIADYAPTEVDELRVDELERLPLGARLRAARQRRRITLVQAELDTRIRMSYIQAMEEEKFSLLPHGPMTETMVRTYAAYLGLNVANALEEYRERHYTAPVEPLVALGGSSLPRSTTPWWVWVAVVMLALVVGIGGILALDPAGAAALGNRARALLSPPTATPTPTLTPTFSPTATSTPTMTPSPTATVTPSPTPEPTATAEPTLTPTATARPRPTPRPQPTPVPPTPEPPTPAPQSEPQPEPPAQP
ncbi:MAG: helix-turn-helix domain-containing protein [Roseiflexaceae bacterium]|nr:helix-turn-helix domain-containing protein [Roseiflexaceae bacterium]